MPRATSSRLKVHLLCCRATAAPALAAAAIRRERRAVGGARRFSRSCRLRLESAFVFTCRQLAHDRAVRGSAIPPPRRCSGLAYRPLRRSRCAFRALFGHRYSIMTGGVRLGGLVLGAGRGASDGSTSHVSRLLVPRHCNAEGRAGSPPCRSPCFVTASRRHMSGLPVPRSSARHPRRRSSCVAALRHSGAYGYLRCRAAVALQQIRGRGWPATSLSSPAGPFSPRPRTSFLWMWRSRAARRTTRDNRQTVA